MIGIDALPLAALETVGIVLAEAIALYVGYGAVTSTLEPRLAAALSEG